MAHEYASQEDLMDRLGIPDGDPRENTLLQAVTAASRWVDSQVGDRRFYTVSQTRYYTLEQTGRMLSGMGYGIGYGGGVWSVQSATWGMGSVSRIVIDDAVSVASVATDQDGDGVYETAWTLGTDYWVGPRNAAVKSQPYRTINRNLAIGRYGFPAWEDSIAVTGAFGYSATVPDQIRELTLYVAELLSRDVLEMSIPGVESFQLGADLRVSMAPTDLPMAYQKVLEQYRDAPFLI